MSITARELGRGLFEVHNRFLFSALDGVTLRWALREAETTVRAPQAAPMAQPRCAPRPWGRFERFSF